MSTSTVQDASRSPSPDWDRIRRQGKSVFAHSIVLLLVMIMLLPLFYMVMMSFKTATEIAQDPLGLPTSLYWGNYMATLSSMGYVRSVLNSLGITVSVIVIVVFAGAMAAYPLARIQNRLSRTIVMIMALGLATPAL